jgi:hypothetical protein
MWNFLNYIENMERRPVDQTPPHFPLTINPPSPLQRRLRLKCDSTRAETKFRLSAKRTSLFKSAGASLQSTTGSRGVRISGSNASCSVVV